MTDEPQRHQLVRQAVAGDGDALQRLIVHYHGLLQGTIEKRMEEALRRHVDAEGILQRAYISAFKSVEGCSFDGPGGFYKWLERIALDRLKKTERDLRRQKRDVGRQLAEPPSPSSSVAAWVDRISSHGPSPSRQLARQEASAALLSSMARLTDDQRTVVRMRFLEDRPVSEVAAALGKSEAAIYTLCTRAMRKLEELLVSITRYLSKA
ncbi:MAG: sigma-70 family RNA polymerase sigma factor [Phycisphaerae bacterium]|nr:sigma-70 family RNA polymerase sigma factor [Phycisphaerae bacterium]